MKFKIVLRGEAETEQQALDSAKLIATAMRHEGMTLSIVLVHTNGGAHDLTEHADTQVPAVDPDNTPTGEHPTVDPNDTGAHAKLDQPDGSVIQTATGAGGGAA